LLSQAYLDDPDELPQDDLMVLRSLGMKKPENSLTYEEKNQAEDSMESNEDIINVSRTMNLMAMKHS
jgi:hypothetical protein